jgi:hypothetical protein
MAVKTFVGTLDAFEPNDRDGNYPLHWRNFHVICADGLRVVFNARTGGKETHFLKWQERECLWRVPNHSILVSLLGVTPKR